MKSVNVKLVVLSYLLIKVVLKLRIGQNDGIVDRAEIFKNEMMICLFTLACEETLL